VNENLVDLVLLALALIDRDPVARPAMEQISICDFYAELREHEERFGHPELLALFKIVLGI
jgi:hypothetical protein